MTDARLPGRWLTDPTLDAISDRLWRVHSNALMWSAEQGTDGLIPRTTLRLLHPEAATPEDARGLVTAGLWTAEGTAYRVLQWEQTQTMAAVVEHQRERNRLKNQALRDRERQKRAHPTPPPVEPSPVTGHVTGYAGGQDRQGQDRSGQASEKPASSEAQSNGQIVGPGASWPTRVPGSDERRTHAPQREERP
jgi:hypothetical protein